MIRFDGDWCRRTKAADEKWILGVAAEAVGITAARRKITIMPRWMRDAAVHPLAVHFCCGECKHPYMARLFNSRPLMKTGAAIATKRRTKLLVRGLESHTPPAAKPASIEASG